MVPDSQARNGSGRSTVADSGRRPLRIVLRLWDWSEWCRQVARGVQRYAHDNPDWHLYVASGPTQTVGNIYARGQRWDGIITHIFDNVAAMRRIAATGRTKVVSFSAAPPTALKGIPSVRVDDVKVAGAIGRHLLSGGFRRLAYRSARLTTPIEDYRVRALQAFAEAEGCPCEIATIGPGPMPSTRSLARWVARLRKPVGVVEWSMPGARRTVEACQHAGVAVPEQVAVVAWDDDALLAESLEPTVSGAVLPAERLGYESAKLLDRLLRGEPTPKEPILVEPPGILHIRQSSDVSSIADRDVHLALQYIREHAGQPLRVSELVKALRVSRSKLERDFLRVTGQTLNQSIVAAHVARAKQLLLETNWPLDRLAERAGFGTKRHFHRVFARSEGLTPADYRARFGGI